MSSTKGGRMNYEREQRHNLLDPRRKDAPGTFTEPKAWEARRRALRTSPTGVQLRRPR